MAFGGKQKVFLWFEGQRVFLRSISIKNDVRLHQHLKLVHQKKERKWIVSHRKGKSFAKHVFDEK